MTAAPLRPGLTPAEASFLAECTLVTVIPQQRLPSLPLLSGPTPALVPPQRAEIPLWLALLLRKQDRAQILPPAWLSAASLERVLEEENSADRFVGGSVATPENNNNNNSNSTNGTNEQERRNSSRIILGPPFADNDATSLAAPNQLPYHWLEIAHLLLEDDGAAAAAADLPDADAVRRLLRDLRETRAAKLRKGIGSLEGGASVRLDGVGGLELSENRAFVAGVVDGLRRIGASKEASRRERELEEREEREGDRRGGYYAGGGDDEDEDML